LFALSFHRISILVIVFFTATLFAQQKEQQPMTLNNWLVVSPSALPFPAFQEKEANLKELMQVHSYDMTSVQPKSGTRIKTRSGSQNWKEVNGSTISFQPLDGNWPQQALAACYLEADQFSKLEVKLTSSHLLQLFLNGKEVAKKESSEAEGDAGELKKTLTLETGKHLLIIRSIHNPQNKQPWTISAEAELKEGTDLQPGLTPTTPFNMQQLLSSPLISGISLSPDGSTTAISLRQVIADDKTESWLELRSTKTGRLLNSYRGFTNLSGVTWSPTGKSFIYISRGKDNATLWMVNMANGSSRALLRDVANFSGYRWAPDGSYIVYYTTKKAKKDERGVHRLTTPRDRWPNFRNRTVLHQLDLNSGQQMQLTSSDVSTSLYAIHPSNNTVLIGQTSDDFDNRPYTKTDLKLLNLADLSVEDVTSVSWIAQASWSPNGKKLAVTGGPRLFGDIGVNVRDGQIPNDYDGQVYLYDLATKKGTALTRTFNPSVNSIRWRDDKNMLLNVIEGEYQPLYNYNLRSKSFRKLNGGTEVINAFDVSSDGNTAVCFGSGVKSPAKAYVIDLKKNKSRLLHFPARSEFSNTTFGEVKDFRFKNSRGDDIDGRVYYPPNFDATKKYPALVHYYGGTVPVTRSFGGRYPNNLFAANGYVVYVLQPSGAIGYGQNFSAYHVNDWGKIVADEIITGTKAFLEAHSFVDRKRVGCIGASYGGFMTMLLTTRTDIFSSAISHAGISSLSSYWGEGFWGYLYSSVATANSFPWNRPDLYVDQSPLFQADKVNTPLLLLTGDSDTNVPRGESDQFYVALKLLGKEVEYIRVEGQDHHILNHKKRLIWQRTILAWFDKHLKSQGAWWSDLYPEE